MASTWDLGAHMAATPPHQGARGWEAPPSQNPMWAMGGSSGGQGDGWPRVGPIPS